MPQCPQDVGEGLEDLATCAVEARPSASTSSRQNWYPIKGSRSLVQTPSPDNGRKLFWGLFGYDPLDDWQVVVVTDGDEMGSGGTWRGRTHTHVNNYAAKFLARQPTTRPVTCSRRRASVNSLETGRCRHTDARPLIHPNPRKPRRDPPRGPRHSYITAARITAAASD